MLNKVGTYSILSVLTCTLLMSCHKVNQDSYVISSDNDVKEYIKEQQETTTYEKKIKEVNYKLKYISNEQMALQQITDLSTINQVKFDSIVRNYDSLLFFNLEINIDHFEGEILQYKLEGDADLSYSERLDYYAFKMQKDIHIVLNEKDTIPCVLYHFERNYGISPNSNFMIGFKTANLKNAVFVFENNYLKTGPIKFALQENTLLNRPKIMIE